MVRLAHHARRPRGRARRRGGAGDAFAAVYERWDRIDDPARVPPHLCAQQLPPRVAAAGMLRRGTPPCSPARTASSAFNHVVDAIPPSPPTAQRSMIGPALRPPADRRRDRSGARRADRHRQVHPPPSDRRPPTGDPDMSDTNDQNDLRRVLHGALDHHAERARRPGARPRRRVAARRPPAEHGAAAWPWAVSFAVGRRRRGRAAAAPERWTPARQAFSDATSIPVNPRPVRRTRGACEGPPSVSARPTPAGSTSRRASPNRAARRPC